MISPRTLRAFHPTYYAREIVLVGPAGEVDRLAQGFARHIAADDCRLAACVCIDGEDLSERALPSLEGSPLTLHCRPEELRRWLFDFPVHEVVLIQPESDRDWVQQVANDCAYLGITVRVWAQPLLTPIGESLLERHPFEPLTLPAAPVQSVGRLSPGAEFAKRLIDILVSGAALALLLPILALIALVIKVSAPSQPILYRLRWVGQNGVRLTGYKFRTMVPDADALKSQLMAKNEMNGPVFKIKDDPRITRVGRVLRKFSLDELPQLWNVLKGDISLVGPRPALVSELSGYQFWHKRRLSVKSGITCLWQVRGRNGISNFDDWVKLDLEYIDRRSWWLDLKILLQTAWAVVRGTGQ